MTTTTESAPATFNGYFGFDFTLDDKNNEAVTAIATARVKAKLGRIASEYFDAQATINKLATKYNNPFPNFKEEDAANDFASARDAKEILDNRRMAFNAAVQAAKEVGLQVSDKIGDHVTQPRS